MKYGIEINNVWYYFDTEIECFKHVEDVTINECKNMSADDDRKDVCILYTYRYNDVFSA